MLMRSLLNYGCLFAALGWVHFASAASFDCAKAGTAHEKLICSESVLDQADLKMGEAYKKAVAAFPIKGFIQTQHKIFLNSYRRCATDKDKQKNIQKCLEVLAERTRDLEDSLVSTVYSDDDPPGPYKPSTVVLQINQTSSKGILRFYGGYIPEYKNPKPFPDGFYCDGDIELKNVDGKLSPVLDIKMDITDTSVIFFQILPCGRNIGLMDKYSRVKR